MSRSKPKVRFGKKEDLFNAYISSQKIPRFQAWGAFIESHVKYNNNEPFFLYFYMTVPHIPILPNDEFMGKKEKNFLTLLITFPKKQSDKIEKQLSFQGRRNIKYSIFSFAKQRWGIFVPILLAARY